MVRTQVYLTEEERDCLAAEAKSTGKKQSELIREAIDFRLDLGRENRKATIIKDAAGMWKDRKDLPDFDSIRRSWDRR